MNNKAFSKIWIFIIVAVLLLGGILAWQYQLIIKSEKPSTSSKIDELNISKEPNRFIDYSDIPEIKKIDEKTKENIYEGVAYYIKYDKNESQNPIVNFEIGREPDFPAYSVKANLNEILVLGDNNSSKLAELSDLEEGSIIKIEGGKEESRCCASPVSILEPKRIIITKKPLLEPVKTYTGRFCDGSFGAIDFYGTSFEPDDSQGLRLLSNKDSDFCTSIIVNVSQPAESCSLKLDSMAQAVELLEDSCRANLQDTEKVMMEGKQICPQDNYPCYLEIKKITILSFYHFTPDTPFAYKGKMISKYLDDNFLIMNEEIGQEFINLNSDTKIYIVSNLTKNKEILDHKNYRLIEIPDVAPASSTMDVEVKGRVICPDLQEIINGTKRPDIDCKKVADTLILQSEE